MTDEKPDIPVPERPIHRKTPPATPLVQAWLDGEETRDHLATADEQETAELWTRINSEAEQLRRRNTPIHVQSRILNSLTDLKTLPDEPAPARFKLSTPMAVIGGMVILALGALLGFMLVR
jgi:hypothetical protein